MQRACSREGACIRCMRGIFFSWCQLHAQNKTPFEFDVCRTGFARCTYHYMRACGLEQRCSPFKPPKTNRPPERLTRRWGSQKNRDGVAQPEWNICFTREWKHGSCNTEHIHTIVVCHARVLQRVRECQLVRHAAHVQAPISTSQETPDPMNYVKTFKGLPLQDAPFRLVQLWYKAFLICK